MNFALRSSILVALSLTAVPDAAAQAVAYTDEGAFLAALAMQGIPGVAESFEDDGVWGGVRTTIVGGPQVAPSVTSLGITWTSNSVNNDITTGNGPARTGQWGFFSLPHGDYPNGLGDGFAGTGEQSLVAIGGWISSNTAPAKIGLYLDGVPVDFGPNDVLAHQHLFFGAIDPAGFSSFEFRELEGTINDQELIFADDFTFAFGGTVVDCNANGVPDPLDISSGLSADCNGDVVPDECQIAGGPFPCTGACDPDCNANGVLDACEVVQPVSQASGPLSPIGNGVPQSFTIASPPMSLDDVVLTFTAHANLGGAQDLIAVTLNGVSLGSVFGMDGSDCPDNGPDTAQLVVPMDTFNAAVAGGDATFLMTASAEVDPQGCDLPTYVALEVTLFVPSDDDTNGNGVPDACESFALPYGFCGSNPDCSNVDADAGCANSTGAGARLDASGSASLTNDDLTLVVTDLPASAPALLLAGEPARLTGAGVVFGDGRWVLTPDAVLLELDAATGSPTRDGRLDWRLVDRLGLRHADGAGSGTWGPGLGLASRWMPGETAGFQVIYRDALGPCASGFNLSNGVAVTLEP